MLILKQNNAIKIFLFVSQLIDLLGDKIIKCLPSDEWSSTMFTSIFVIIFVWFMLNW